MSNQNTPLNLQLPDLTNAFTSLYRLLRKSSIDILSKNQAYGKETLAADDIEQIGKSLSTEVAIQIKELERNLFILPTIASLAPFLGLLGTVWGILITLSELQTHAASMSLGGMSMALSTTVLGLLVAIPPLIANNYLRATLREIRTDLDTFSRQALSAVELQYRAVIN